MTIVYVDRGSGLVNFQSGTDALTEEVKQTFIDNLDDAPGMF